MVTEECRKFIRLRFARCRLVDEGSGIAVAHGPAGPDDTLRAEGNHASCRIERFGGLSHVPRLDVLGHRLNARKGVDCVVEDEDRRIEHRDTLPAMPGRVTLADLPRSLTALRRWPALCRFDMTEQEVGHLCGGHFGRVDFEVNVRE